MTTPEVEILTHHGTELAAVFYEVGTGYDETAGNTQTFTLSDFDHNESIQFTGTGFRFNDDGSPRRGTVTSISVQQNDKDYADVTHISVSLTKVFDILKSGHVPQMYDLFGDMGFTGGPGGDFIMTGKGNDHIHGLGGDDTIAGGAGADDLFGGRGSDTADYSTATQDGVVASLADTSINTHDAEGDTYSSIENLIGTRFSDNLYGDRHNNDIDGGAKNDVLGGNGGVDTLHGGAGNDRLDGGASSDIQYGGAGADQFLYVRSDIGHSEPDRIMDWDSRDTFMINAQSFGHGLVAGHALTNAQFHLDEPSGQNGQFVYSTADGNLFWYANGVDSTSAPIVAEIVGAPDLTKGDITVFDFG